MTTSISDLTYTDYLQATNHLSRWSVALELAEVALIDGPVLDAIDAGRPDLGEAMEDLSVTEQDQVMDAATRQVREYGAAFGSALIEQAHLLVDARGGDVPARTASSMSLDEVRDVYADNPAKRYALEAVAA